MAEQGSRKGRLGVILLAALGASVVSLLALTQADTPARAQDSDAGTDLERDAEFPSFAQDASGSGEPRIVGGTPVPNNKYRFMARLQIRNRGGTSSYCGGTLIDRNSVLTAAHCVDRARAVRVVVGRTVLSQNNGQIRNATAVFVHPRYRGSRGRAYDSAVLKLGSAVRGIRPISLSSPRQNTLEKPGRTLRTAGWGATRSNGPGQNRMREATVPVVADAAAKRAYGPAYTASLMVAASSQRKGTCFGDSGGPLFAAYPSGGRVQVGITSGGYDCERKRYPDVYTEVNAAPIRNHILSAARR